MPLTNFLNGNGIGGTLSRFRPNVIGPNSDAYAYSRLFYPKRLSVGNQLDFTCWRSTPVGAGTNAVGFVVNSLRARPIEDANAPWPGQFGPSIIKPGWSRIPYENTVDGGYWNVLLTFGYMQIPPAGWPTPSTAINPNSNEGFFFFDNPIGQTVPPPSQYGTSIWTVVLATDSQQYRSDAAAPLAFEWSAHITGVNNTPINISPTGVIS